MSELYKKHRPQTFKEVVGQAAAIKSLMDMGKRNEIPHTLLFTGPSGCGKTTLARILRNRLKCSDHDFMEVNASENRGIDFVRRLKTQVGMAPLGGECRVILLDEVHQFTSDAQDAILKLLEDTPSHVYFFLCTTDPQKLKKTVLTRCTEIKVVPLSIKDAELLIKRTLEAEGAEPLQVDVSDELIEMSQGSARKLMVLLHSVIGLPPDQQIDALANSSAKSSGTSLAKSLLTAKSFADVVPALKEIKAAGEDAEGIRRMILGYHAAILLNKPSSSRCFYVLEAFSDNTYDTGFSGLVRASYELFGGE